MAYSLTEPNVPAYGRTATWANAFAQPNLLVRIAFYFALFAIPFGRIYLPGTGERLGVTRIAQLLIVAAILSQPRVCIRRIPIALVFFAGYCLLRIAMGQIFSPNLVRLWWDTTFDLMQLLFMFWFLFNVLQCPGMGRRGLWAFVAGASACALLHILDIGTVHLPPDGEERISVFGENANVLAVTYGVALIAAMGLLIHRRMDKLSFWVLLPALALIGGGVAMTGSRSGGLLILIGLFVLMIPVKPARFNAKTFVLFFIIAAMFAGILYRVPVMAVRAKGSGASSWEDEPRRKMFPVLVQIFLRSPIYGHGPDTYREELTWRAMPHRFAQGKSSISAHNLVLLTLVEMGLIGFALFAGGFALTIKAAWRSRAGSLRLIPLALVVPLGVIGVATGTPHYAAAFWVAMAYGLSDTRHAT